MKIKIDSKIDRVRVEIEGRLYPLAEKTRAVADALIAARKRLRRAPEYRLWQAELRILLGRRAMARLFRSGSRENLDRMQRIHSGVLRAFEHNAEAVNSERLLDALMHACADSAEPDASCVGAHPIEGR